MPKYEPPIAELSNEAANVYVHNKSGIAPGHTHIIKYAPDEKLDPVQVLGSANASQLRQLFATAADTVEPSLILLHFGTQNTNSQQTELNIHRVSGKLAEEFRHIQSQKTYVPHPNMILASLLESAFVVRSSEGMIVVDLSAGDLFGCEAEAASHMVLMHPGYVSLGEFAEKASNKEILEFSAQLKSLIEPHPDGVRVVIDERYSNTGFLTVHALAGENLGQGAPHRWFEKPPELACS